MGGYIYTAPVGNFTENQYGLADMLGNVLEWIQDCWHESYQNAPGDCIQRVVLAVLGTCGRLIVSGSEPMKPAATSAFVSPGIFDFCSLRGAGAESCKFDFLLREIGCL